MNDVTIKDNSFLRQFETRVNGPLAKIEYSSQERKVFLTKLVIPEEIKNEDFKEEFIKSVLHHIQGQNLRVVPTSPQMTRSAMSARMKYPVRECSEAEVSALIQASTNAITRNQ